MKNIYFIVLSIASAVFSNPVFAHEGHGPHAFGGLLHAFQHPETWLALAVVVIALAILHKQVSK